MQYVTQSHQQCENQRPNYPAKNTSAGQIKTQMLFSPPCMHAIIHLIFCVRNSQVGGDFPLHRVIELPYVPHR